MSRSSSNLVKARPEHQQNLSGTTGYYIKENMSLFGTFEPEMGLICASWLSVVDVD